MAASRFQDTSTEDLVAEILQRHTNGRSGCIVVRREWDGDASAGVVTRHSGDHDLARALLKEADETLANAAAARRAEQEAST